ncbi:MAG: hypothetical protein Q8S55_14845 [Methylococcaceae bacterium]|nr:hypothetical protein [Methylococcaceae bacterium]
MKTLALSSRRVVEKDVGFSVGGVGFTVHAGVFADDGGVLRRTRVKRLSAFVRGVSSDNTVSFDPILVGIISVKDYHALPQGEQVVYDVDDLLDRSVYVVSVDAVRSAGIEPLTSNVSGVVSANSNLNMEVVVPLNEYGSLTCGTDFVIWVSGGAFAGLARVTVEIDRVEITQDEYMKYYAGACQ